MSNDFRHTIFLSQSDIRYSSSPTSVGSLTGLNSFKAVRVTRLAELQRGALAFQCRVAFATPYLPPRLEIELEGVPVELLTTYHFLTENDERGRHGIVIRLL